MERMVLTVASRKSNVYALPAKCRERCQLRLRPTSSAPISVARLKRIEFLSISFGTIKPKLRETVPLYQRELAR
jgi:hypothetical protein